MFVYIDDTDLLLPPFDPDIIVLYCIFLLECGLHRNRNNKAGGADRTGSAGHINCQIYIRYKREKDTGMSEVSQIVPCPFKVFFLLILFSCILFLPSFYCFMCFVHVLLMMITLSGKDRRAAGDRSGTGQGSVRAAGGSDLHRSVWEYRFSKGLSRRIRHHRP